MFDTENLLQQAVSAFYPSDRVFARVKKHVFEKAQKTQNGVVLVCVNRDSRKIFNSVFKAYDKLMQRIA